MYARATIVGRLTRDPELRKTGNDTSVVNFSLATNRRFNKEEVDFFDITAWRQLAELVAAYKSKGDLVLVEGDLQIDTWQQDGTNRTKPAITADKVVFLPSANDNKNNSASTSNSSGESDEVPF